ncbi:MAG: hypothetical protein OXU66_01395 [Gammaproteobacteria bacterium]|nr:hypothetical protein [Gammaproteobacteria bacterium]MDD9957569.1 hypothetical protein [Gammaproteobacteria bacterium]
MSINKATPLIRNIAIYLVLLALLIPWYWPEGEARILFGFPIWILASLGALFLTSCFTAWLCLRNKGSAD